MKSSKLSYSKKCVKQYADGGSTSDVPSSELPWNELESKQKLKRVGTGAAVGAAGVGMALLNDSDKTNQGRRTGQAIGAGIGGVITAINPIIGAVATPVLSAIGGSIGGDSDSKNQSKKINTKMYDASMARNFGINDDMHGDQGAYYFEEGGVVLDEPEEIDNQNEEQIEQSQSLPQQPKFKTINIEKGEIAVNSQDMSVVRKFTNSAVFSPHSKSKFKEPSGNFVEVPEGVVIIPKKLASRYEKGDNLTRSSILGQILQQQALNPEQNEPQHAAPFMEDGGSTDDDVLDPDKRSFIGPPTYPLDVDPLSPVDKYGRPTNIDADGNFKEKRLQELRVKAHKIKSMTPLAVGTEQFSKPTIQGTPVEFNTHLRVPMDQLDPTAGKLKYDNRMIGRDLNLPTTIEGTKTKKLKAKPSNPSNSLMTGSLLANLAPTVYGLMQANTPNQYAVYDENQRMEDAKTRIRNIDTNVSVDAPLYKNQNALASLRRAIQHNNGPQSLAIEADNIASIVGANNQLYNDRNMQMKTLAANKANLLSDFEMKQGDHELQRRDTLRSILEQDEANRQNMTQQGLSELSRNISGFRNDKESIKAMNSITGLYDLDPFHQKLIKDDPNSSTYINNYMKNYGVNRRIATQMVADELAKKEATPKKKKLKK